MAGRTMDNNSAICRERLHAIGVNLILQQLPVLQPSSRISKFIWNKNELQFTKYYPLKKFDTRLLFSLTIFELKMTGVIKKSLYKHKMNVCDLKHRDGGVVFNGINIYHKELNLTVTVKWLARSQKGYWKTRRKIGRLKFYYEF